MHFVFMLEVIFSRTSNQSLLWKAGRPVSRVTFIIPSTKCRVLIVPRKSGLKFWVLVYVEPDIKSKFIRAGRPAGECRRSSSSRLKCVTQLAKWSSHASSYRYMGFRYSRYSKYSSIPDIIDIPYRSQFQPTSGSSV